VGGAGMRCEWRRGHYTLGGAPTARNFVTRAQGSATFVAGGQVVWLGNQWVTSALPGRPRNHDLLYFAPLSFRANGTLDQLAWHDNVTLPVTTNAG